MKVPGLRSDYQKIGGIVYFGRMLDKIRLNAAGRLPAGYFVGTANRTHFDSRCTRFLRVDYQALAGRVLEGGSDEEILEWCFQMGRRLSDEDIEVWSAFICKRGLRDSPDILADLEDSKIKSGLSHRSDIDTYLRRHDAEEGRAPIG